MINKENLQKAIDTLPDSLIACYLFDGENYCVVGHMLHAVGIPDQLLLAHSTFVYFGGEIGYQSYYELLSQHYGINALDSKNLLHLNDNTASSRRVTKCKQALERLLHGDKVFLRLY